MRAQDILQCPATAGKNAEAGAPRVQGEVLNKVVKAAIYPSIGVGRVGDSETHYLGPETVDFTKKTVDIESIRDESGLIKPQAARFRVYGLNALGDVVCELTGGKKKGVQIEWKVHLANSKAAGYKFEIAMDIEEAKTYEFTQGPDINGVPKSTKGCVRRNLWKTEDREHLVFSAKASISKGSKAPVDLIAPARDWAEGKHVPDLFLGKATCGRDGRLCLIGGKGHSKGFERAYTFGNNDYWYDDVSDGPVTATVSLNGADIPVSPAWFIVGPPNYGGELQQSVRTMWDLMRDIAVGMGSLPAPKKPSFTNDIYPIFRRLTNLQWVNSGFAAQFGFNSEYDFTSERWIKKLRSNDRSAAGIEKRRILFHQFRNPKFSYNSSWAANGTWPPIYGDTIGEESPRAMSSISSLQVKMLSQWVDGDFDDDWDEQLKKKALSPQEEADTLTRAQLDSCLADAFHPGCEMTWPVRASTMYSEPFRFLHAYGEQAALGDYVTYDNITTPNGPLYGQRAGDITRWMAMPWQTDTASCRSGYQAKTYDPSLPTFWPARVPNQVLTWKQYDMIKGAETPEAATTAFEAREDWDDPLNTKPGQLYIDAVNNMVALWSTDMGVLVPQPGPKGSGLPEIIYVADRPLPDKK
jgi:hypothetical protein